MRVAIVHDDLVQWGGAERTLEGLCEIYPNAPIYTSVFDKNNPELKKRFAHKRVVTSFLQRVPGWKKLYKSFLPLYPLAFEQFDFADFDLVISQTTRFAKAIITKPETMHICYCHTPPRFLWHFSKEASNRLLGPLLSWLRVYDQITAARVDIFLAGSKNAKERIKRVYGRDSRVLTPFIDLKRFDGIETFKGGYFVTISRLNNYKRVDLTIQACKEAGLNLKVIGSGSQSRQLRSIAGEGVDFLGNISDDMVREVLAGAEALIISGIEDFGLTALEAQSLGKPVIAFREGGCLETVIDQKTGLLFTEQTVDSLRSALKKFRQLKFDPQICKENAARFGKEQFIRNFEKMVAYIQLRY